MEHCIRCFKTLGYFDSRYDGLCKECYEKGIREKEEFEEKIKKAEMLNLDNDVYNCIKQNICKYRFLVYLYNCMLYYDIQLLDDYNHRFKGTSFILIKKIIAQFCLELGSKSFSLENLIEIFKSTKFFNLVISQCVNNIEYRPDSRYIKNIIDICMQQSFINASLLGKLEDYLSGSNKEIYEEYIYSALSESENNIFDIPVENKFYSIYYSTFLLLYMTKFCDNFKYFHNNTELYTMYQNLRKQEVDDIYIIDKLYDMYLAYYMDTFENQIDKGLFTILIVLEHDNDFMRRLLDELFLYIYKSINNIKNEKNIDVNILIDYYKQFDIKSIHKVIENYGRNKEDTLCLLFLDALKENIDYEEILGIIYNKKKLYNELERLDTVSALEKERERLLNGDMSKEIEMQKQKVEYSNVKDGYEFEEYVANLYRKLGYTIEEVTKKSGDQGADVIAYKDNVKYVIQVKFYNNPVGNKAVQEVVGAIGMYKANKGIVVTNSTFTSSAIELAQANNIELVDGEKIEEYKKIIIDSI